ncbi:5-formyltetrahydrofolate cyclo-ligase [Pedobacter frigoris]|uniref:5-formyltetrahydrofolate cyclo-ligase n=1 Tax=Pedobacter frigoris TaxID=2571272 RepID=A0A4U1CEL7_9SPHI|nr:5-formyltetrahydrofolate cyclo-ligase [Pedobacter frigoris]TKC04960.1 5-formyltetrahydrofolate cyclo-ligase [Pedobacter frigoris]
MNKAEVRKQALLQRKGLSPEEASVFNSKLLAQFKNLDFDAIKTLHIFLPIAEKKEPDTFLLIDWLSLAHPEIKIIVPRADFDTFLMSNYVYEGKKRLEKNSYNILEPQKTNLHEGAVDMVIIPLLGFDLKGYRVGYGKGFYDRFLNGIFTVKVGLNFFAPVDVINDVHENDIALDLCITPDKIYFF